MIEMIEGHIYSISFGGNVQVIARYWNSDCTQHKFFSHIHYWNGYETYYAGGYCVKSGITEIREATKCEKHNLIKFEIEKNTL